jgi:hypothetical protein
MFKKNTGFLLYFFPGNNKPPFKINNALFLIKFGPVFIFSYEGKSRKDI